MRYDRKIKYLDYVENGVRAGGGGFAKLEMRNGQFLLRLQVSGLHGTDSFQRDVILLTSAGESVLGQMELKEGAGSFQYQESLEKGIGQKGIDYGELQGLRVPISNTREVQCIWGKGPGSTGGIQTSQNGNREKSGFHMSIEPDARTAPDGWKAQEPEKEQETKRRQEPEKEQETKGGREPGKGQETKRRQEPEKGQETKRRQEPEKEQETKKGQEIHPRQMDPAPWTIPDPGAGRSREMAARIETVPDIRELTDSKTGFDRKPGSDLQAVSDLRTAPGPQEAGMQEMSSRPVRSGSQPASDRQTASGDRTAQGKTASPRHVRLLEDKWQQLSAIYPHVQPFKDERDYLSIRPSDFVLLPSKSYQAANNSFLLHGYYNYHHLILARMEKRGEVTYYLGVPGNYYPKEKQVAVMFGFESFESGQEPAQAGDFGYYMMRTEL